MHAAASPHSSAAEDADDIFLWGARSIGEAINRNERQAYHLLESGKIPCARKVGDKWVARRRSLLRFFGGEAA